MKRHRLLVAVFASMALAGWSGDTEIIVESFGDGLNSQAFSKVSGKWNDSSGKSTAPGVQATKSVYNDADTEAATARFTPDIPVAGKYEVFITYPAQGNATDVKYTVVSSDGSKDIALTQFGRSAGNKPAANEWYSLGVFNFAAGASGYVEVSDPATGLAPLANEPNKRIYADAVKLVPQGVALPADYANKKGGAGGAPAAVAAATSPAVVPPAPANAAPVAGLPVLPSDSPAATPAADAVASLPGLPAATPAVVADASMPALPPAPAAAPAGLPALPNGTPAVGLPPLPAETPAAGLPALPAATPAAPGLPSLPAATPATEMPALPAATPATAGLPALPAETPAAAAPALPALPGVAAPTPVSTPNLPSLAPVTPTPERRMPSPSDTPVSGQITGLPGGPLSALPPMPGPGQELPTGPAAPLATPGLPPLGELTGAPAAGLPPMGGAVTPTPVPAAGNLSITQYNPANLQWMYDFGAALNTARAQNKKVMVFFTATGNQVAATYETEYFMHPAVRQALNNYVLVKVDFPRNTRLGYSLGIFGAGIIVVTDPTGNVTQRIEQIPATAPDLIKLMAMDKPAVATPTPGAGTAVGATSGTAAMDAATTGLM